MAMGNPYGKSPGMPLALLGLMAGGGRSQKFLESPYAQETLIPRWQQGPGPEMVQGLQQRWQQSPGPETMQTLKGIYEPLLYQQFPELEGMPYRQMPKALWQQSPGPEVVQMLKQMYEPLLYQQFPELEGMPYRQMPKALWQQSPGPGIVQGLKQTYGVKGGF